MYTGGRWENRDGTNPLSAKGSCKQAALTTVNSKTHILFSCCCFSDHEQFSNENWFHIREPLPALSVCTFWLPCVMLALTGSSAGFLLLSVSVSNSSLIIVTGSNLFDTYSVGVTNSSSANGEPPALINIYSRRTQAELASTYLQVSL